MYSRHMMVIWHGDKISSSSADGFRGRVSLEVYGIDLINV
jgi:hypothetical protein